MPDLGDALLDRMIRTLVAEADPEQVILFGSRARGDARPDSDVDLLVVESEPFGAGRCRHAETVRLCQALPAARAAAGGVDNSGGRIYHHGLAVIEAARRFGADRSKAALSLHRPIMAPVAHIAL